MTVARTTVEFELSRTVRLTPDETWDRLVDWSGHGDWIPLTRVDVDPDDPSRFTAWSGIGRLMLEDRMHELERHRDGDRGYCRVAKLGPVLVGEAEFSVTPGLTRRTAVVQWREVVTVAYLPAFLAPVAAWIGRTLFAQALGRIGR